MSHSYSHANAVYVNQKGHSLWVGDIQAAENVAWLKEKNIKTVITAASGFSLNYDASIKHINYPLVDSKTQEITQYLDIAAYQIQKWLNVCSVLVHCGAGVSRSASIAIAYLIRYHRFSFKEALRTCKQQRFELQLKAYEKKRADIQKRSSVEFQRSTVRPQSKILPFLQKYDIEKESMTKTGVRIRLSKPNHSKYYSQIEMPTGEGCDRRRELDWLKKIAEFRFGATNTSRWRIQGSPLELSSILLTKR